MTKGETRNFWIQIQCPDLVRLWRIALMGKDTNKQRIYQWRLEGSTDGDTFTVLYEAPNPTFIGSEVRFFPIETTERFNIFRLFLFRGRTRKSRTVVHATLCVHSITSIGLTRQQLKILFTN